MKICLLLNKSHKICPCGTRNEKHAKISPLLTPAFIFDGLCCPLPVCIAAATGIHPAAIKMVSVNVDAGNVSVIDSPDGALVVYGVQACAQSSTLRLDTTNGVLTVMGTAQKRLFQDQADTYVMLNLQVPAGIPVQVATNDASISIPQYAGDLKVDSVAGNITAQALSGEAQLRSGRGNVTLGDSSGVFHVLGEHGILDIENSHGSIDFSTIMGMIQYQGIPGVGGQHPF